MPSFTAEDFQQKISTFDKKLNSYLGKQLGVVEKARVEQIASNQTFESVLFSLYEDSLLQKIARGTTWSARTSRSWTP